MVNAVLVILLPTLSSSGCEADIKTLAEASLELEQVRAHENEIQQGLGEATKSLAQAIAPTTFTPADWCQLLSDQCTWLLQRAHAPLLARRLAYSLEQCSGTSQQLFDRLLAASGPPELIPAPDEDDGAGDAALPSSSFARERAAMAVAYLKRPQTQRAASCEDMAEGLVAARHRVAHERLFVAFLACQAKGTP